MLTIHFFISESDLVAVEMTTVTIPVVAGASGVFVITSVVAASILIYICSKQKCTLHS